MRFGLIGDRRTLLQRQDAGRGLHGMDEQEECSGFVRASCDE